MPKNSSTLILKRWREMDRLLCHYQLDVLTFANEWSVSTKTVRRDLAAFRELGQKLRKSHDDETNEWYWSYEKGTTPLFSSNLLKPGV